MDEETIKRFEQILKAREFYVVGKKVARVDALDAVLGRPMYTTDLLTSKALYVRAVRSPHPHALIRSIDSSATRSVRGVVDVITHREIPGVNDAGSLTSDRPLLAVDRVRHYGEAVALVVGEDEVSVDEGIAAFRVEYEPLPAVFDPVEALKPDAPVITKWGVNAFIYGSGMDGATKPGRPGRPFFLVRRGDVETAFKQADKVVKGSYIIPPIEHAPIEPHVCVAKPEHGGKLTIYTTT
ncbi:MAG: molybdopterin cofactor-binding domain-containing protein, partial [Nitrososphaerota archaeon]